MIHNYLKSLIATIFLFFLCFAGFTQGMVSMPIRTPYGTVTHSYYIPGPNLNYGMISSEKIMLEVTMKNDSTFTAKTQVVVVKDSSYILVKNNSGKQVKIYSSETKDVKAFPTSPGARRGIATDSCWLFLTKKGSAIQSYESSPFHGVIAIQQGDTGRILPFTKENLEPMVASDPRSLKLCRKNKLMNALGRFNFIEKKKKLKSR